MKRRFLVLVIMLSFSFLWSGCQRAENKTIEEPLFEIYLAKPFEGSPDLKNLPLQEKPVVTEKDINKYFWKEHQIEFNNEYLSRRNSMQNSDTKKPSMGSLAWGGSKLLGAMDPDAFVVIIRGERIYLGRFKLGMLSSKSPGPIEIEDVNDRMIRIRFNGGIEDPRSDNRIYNVLKELGKLID